MTFEQRCQKLVTELSTHHREREQVLMDAVKCRLEVSFSTYEKELTNSVNYLTRRKEINVLKKMSKL